MLATNFSEKKEISFKLKQNIETLNDDQENLFIYIKNNSFVINEDSIKNSQIEEKVLSYWNSKNYKNIIILNDNKSNLQKLIFILDILKKNQIKNVSFADDPKFKFKKEVNLSDSINLIPMINLVFLLLIFFLLTGIIQKKEDPSILIPESDQGMKKDNFSGNLTIQVNENGILKLNEKIITSEDLNTLKIEGRDMLILNIDKNVKIKKTNEIFKNIKSAGFEKIFINVSEKDASN